MAPLEVRWLRAGVDEVRQRLAELVNIAKRARLVEEAADLQAAEAAVHRISQALAAKEESRG